MKGGERTIPALRATYPAQGASHPFGGEKVHWTFSFFRLALMKGGEKSSIFRRDGERRGEKKYFPSFPRRGVCEADGVVCVRI